MNCENCAHFKACSRLIDEKHEELIPCEEYQIAVTVDAAPAVRYVERKPQDYSIHGIIEHYWNGDVMSCVSKTVKEYCEAQEVHILDHYNLDCSDVAEFAKWKQERDDLQPQWISVEDRLPEEHDTIFKKFQNTEKWNCSMFEKVSDNVNVYGYYQDGNKFVTTSTTRDGKWNISSIFQMTVTHWMPLPEPPKEEHP